MLLLYKIANPGTFPEVGDNHINSANPVPFFQANTSVVSCSQEPIEPRIIIVVYRGVGVSGLGFRVTV